MKRNISFSQEKQKRIEAKIHWKDVVKSKKSQLVDYLKMNRHKEIAETNDDEWFAKEQAIEKLREANE